MIIDIRQLPDGGTVNCDLCVIGGGAAGISLALEFVDSSASVVLLESGGLEKFPAGSSFELWFWRKPGTKKRKYAVDVSVGWILDRWVLGRWVGPVSVMGNGRRRGPAAGMSGWQKRPHRARSNEP